MPLSIFIKSMPILFLALLFFSQVVFAQKTNHVFEPKGNLDCFYKKIYSASQRKEFYPFAESDSIKLVSFRYHVNGIPIRKDSVIADSIVEEMWLPKEDISKLTDILYNNFFKARPNYGVTNQCFTPRNAILFYNKLGKLVESIVICFHCENYKASSAEIKMGDNCTEKIEKIRKLFISKDIIFGTDPKILSYPGETFRTD